MKSEKFLQFNGKTIFFQSYDGQFWIAIKPICEALNVHYNRQLLTMKADDFFGDVYSLQDMHDAKMRLQKMVCLPEKYIYGWILSLQSQSPELKAYKKECYDVLYNYFHGTITGRKELLKTKVEIDLEMIATEKLIMQSESYMKMEELRKKKNEVKKRLSSNDKEAEKEIIDLFHQPE